MVPPASRPPPPPGPAFSERFRSRNPLGVSLTVALSALLHIALLAFLLVSPRMSSPGSRRVIEAPEWLIALARPITDELFITLESPTARVAARPEPAARPVPVELPNLVAPAPELAPPAPSPAPAPGGMVGREARAEPAGGAGLPGGGPDRGAPRTAAERLRPGEKDPGLWFILPEEIVGLSPEQRLQLEMALAIRAMGDSAAAVAEMARAFTDWTYTDDEGRRWGVSPGQLHLGDITIPLPFGFEPPPNSLAARRTREDAEIASQAGRQEARASLRDRAAEIRRRRDAERARARGDTSSVGAR